MNEYKRKRLIAYPSFYTLLEINIFKSNIFQLSLSSNYYCFFSQFCHIY